MKFLLCIPTYNAGNLWNKWIKAYESQSVTAEQVIVIDSSSSDDTVKLAKDAMFSVFSIPQSEFNHGRTRNQAVRFAENFADVLVFMTQDAILASPDSLEKLLVPFSDPEVAAVCGRQLPHHEATPLAVHARYFNYPSESRVRTMADISALGIKTAFMSNTILAEDMYLAAKMILSGYKVAYCAEATVFHSHNYTLKQEFQRYFDTGVFQQEQKWIQQKFGSAASEGKRFVLSELKFLSIKSPHLIPKAILSTCVKWLGFKLGYYYYRLPYKWCRVFSMHKGYWDKVT